MKTLRIYTLFFSFLFSVFSAQDSDSVIIKPKYEPNFMVGFDVLNAGLGVFSKRKVFQGFVSSKIKKDLHAVADLGFESNVYQKNGYDAKASGLFVKAGGFYMLMKDPENELNGFYAGPKIGAAFYNQEYMQVPVRGQQGGDSYLSFPGSTQSSYWLEAGIGGRVQLFDSNFYIDVNVQPKYLVYSTKQEDIKPMIVPGFGRASAKFNMGFAWNIAYQF